ncbi:MAG: nitroreductase family protein [Planctomycetota bacterium]|jgi:nitroreductase|nr:nitroreductase family protein [Planctomycetota bacterium]
MNFEQLAGERYSLRQFSPEPVEAEALARILKAGRIAPTAANRQPQRVLVVNDRAGMEKLAKCTKYTFGAPMALLVCYDATKSWIRPFDGDNAGVVDASIAVTHMMLQAADLGLGSTWVGYFDPAKVKAEFALPEGYVPAAILPLGHPGPGAAPHPRHFERLPAEEVVFYNRF